MERTLDDSEIVDFNISDCFLFGKHLRHLPSIMNYDYTSMKILDMGHSTIILSAQAIMYFPLASSLVEKLY